MKDKKVLTVFITEEEQAWIHKVARANKSSITMLFIGLLEQRSKELEIPLPMKRYRRKPSSGPHGIWGGTKHKYVERMSKELRIND